MTAVVYVAGLLSGVGLVCGWAIGRGIARERRISRAEKKFRALIDEALKGAVSPADCPCPNCTERRRAAESKN